MTLGGKLQVSQSVAVSRFQASLCCDLPMQRVGFVCFFLAFSTQAHTSRLMLGGVIADKYNSSTLVGLRHPVIARHTLLSSESSL